MTKTELSQKLIQDENFPVMEVNIFLDYIERILFENATSIEGAFNNWIILAEQIASRADKLAKGKRNL